MTNVVDIVHATEDIEVVLSVNLKSDYGILDALVELDSVVNAALIGLTYPLDLVNELRAEGYRE